VNRTRWVSGGLTRIAAVNLGKLGLVRMCFQIFLTVSLVGGPMTDLSKGRVSGVSR